MSFGQLDDEILAHVAEQITVTILGRDAKHRTPAKAADLYFRCLDALDRERGKRTEAPVEGVDLTL